MWKISNLKKLIFSGFTKNLTMKDLPMLATSEKYIPKIDVVTFYKLLENVNDSMKLNSRRIKDMSWITNDKTAYTINNYLNEGVMSITPFIPYVGSAINSVISKSLHKTNKKIVETVLRTVDENTKNGNALEQKKWLKILELVDQIIPDNIKSDIKEKKENSFFESYKSKISNFIKTLPAGEKLLNGFGVIKTFENGGSVKSDEVKLNKEYTKWLVAQILNYAYNHFTNESPLTAESITKHFQELYLHSSCEKVAVNQEILPNKNEVSLDLINVDNAEVDKGFVPEKHKYSGEELLILLASTIHALIENPNNNQQIDNYAAYDSDSLQDNVKQIGNSNITYYFYLNC